MKNLIIFLVAVMTVSYAEARRDGKREHRQEARIAHGVKNGELTKREARKLAKKQHKIDRFQKKAMADGEMSAQEKLKLERMQDRQNKAIFKQKHDRQDRDQNTPPSGEPVITQPAPVEGVEQPVGQ